MSFWFTPLSPGRSRITLHLITANPELAPLPFKLLVRAAKACVSVPGRGQATPIRAACASVAACWGGRQLWQREP